MSPYLYWLTSNTDLSRDMKERSQSNYIFLWTSGTFVKGQDLPEICMFRSQSSGHSVLCQDTFHALCYWKNSSAVLLQLLWKYQAYCSWGHYKRSNHTPESMETHPTYLIPIWPHFISAGVGSLTLPTFAPHKDLIPPQIISLEWFSLTVCIVVYKDICWRFMVMLWGLKSLKQISDNDLESGMTENQSSGAYEPCFIVIFFTRLSDLRAHLLTEEKVTKSHGE